MTRRRAPTELESGAAPAGERAPLLDLFADWLGVPRDPPALPPGRHDWARSFRPSIRYFRYLRTRYLLGAIGFSLVIGIPLLFGMFVLHRDGAGGVALALIILVGLPIVLWMVLGFAVLRLQFDTTWYVMTDRALRIRSGIWVIREQTVTFDNAQNVRVRRGPIQRMLGIGDVTVETASAGTVDQHGNASPNTAVIAGVDNPGEIRDRITTRMRAARGAGLGGDEDPSTPAPGGTMGWSPAHLAALREIRDEVSRSPA